jgi:hypothetical protein
MYFNDTLSYHRWEKDKFLKEEYSKEELERLYNDVVIFNLSSIYSTSYSKFIWRDLREFDAPKGNLVDDFTLNTHNLYLRNITDKTVFARHLVEVGFYLPVHTSSFPDGKITISSGKHRIASLKLLDEMNQWDGRNILTIDTPLTNTRDPKSIKNTLPDKLDKKLKVRVFMSNLFTIDYPLFEEEFISKCLESKNGVRISEDIAEISTDSPVVFYRCIHLSKYWMADMFYVYKKNTGKYISSSKIINNESEVYKWLDSIEMR